MVKKTAHRQKVLDALHNAKNDPKAFWENWSHVCQQQQNTSTISKEEWCRQFYFFLFFLVQMSLLQTKSELNWSRKLFQMQKGTWCLMMVTTMGMHG